MSEKRKRRTKAVSDLDEVPLALVGEDVLGYEVPAKRVDDRISEGKDTSIRRSSSAGAESEYKLAISTTEPLCLSARLSPPRLPDAAVERCSTCSRRAMAEFGPGAGLERELDEGALKRLNRSISNNPSEGINTTIE